MIKMAELIIQKIPEIKEKYAKLNEKKFTEGEMQEFLKKYGRKYSPLETEAAFEQLYKEHGDEINKLLNETEVLPEDQKFIRDYFQFAEEIPKTPEMEGISKRFSERLYNHPEYDGLMTSITQGFTDLLLPFPHTTNELSVKVFVEVLWDSFCREITPTAPDSVFGCAEENLILLATYYVLKSDMPDDQRTFRTLVRTLEEFADIINRATDNGAAFLSDDIPELRSYVFAESKKHYDWLCSLKVRDIKKALSNLIVFLHTEEQGGDEA